MDRVERIRERLERELAAEHVAVEDESHRHAGHEGAKSGGGHFRATIVSPRFAGLSRVAAQRLVYAALGELMAGEIHAIAMSTYTPEEWRAKEAR
jgi:BolA protein